MNLIIRTIPLFIFAVYLSAHAAESTDDFTDLFDGNTMTGWVGDIAGYEARNGVLTCLPGKDKGGSIFSEMEYDDFIIRFEFKLTPGANNGLALRCPREGKPSSKGFESQILDNSSKRYDSLQETQYHGSLYKRVAARRGFLKPVGEWNMQEVMMNGNHAKITLNGTVILEEDDIGRFKRPSKGHVGFLGHGTKVQFRNIKIKKLAQ